MVASAIRNLSIDAVQRANSGHPGLPLGCAELGAYLYGYFLYFCAKNPDWPVRDRFILSAGHGCMLQYACLHLAGFDISLKDLESFRQLHSKTPGHPEAEITPGIETTTGPLGQGVGHAVGQALGMKLLAARFAPTPPDFDRPKVIALAGDGCMMEGITAEASSLAGHLQLDNLILIYDANEITLDGPLSDSCSEDTEMRYRAYGWDVARIDGHDLQAIHASLEPLRRLQKRPTLIIAKTQIGHGSPNRAGSHKAHGSPLGPDEVMLVKKWLNFPQDPFFVPEQARTHFAERAAQDQKIYSRWNREFENYLDEHPQSRQLWQPIQEQVLPDLEKVLSQLVIKSPLSGRLASQAVICELAKHLPYLYGGSADLSGSDMTMISDSPIVKRGSFCGRNIKFGVREFAMATIAVGLGQTQLILPFIGTFLTFSDYMRNAIRLSALMGCKMVYQFTHDSIFLGEDGPTHQSVEHLAALRAIPRLQVIRPADSNEVKGAWISALGFSGPTAIVLSRQNLPQLIQTDRPHQEGVGRGAYLLKPADAPDVTLYATGSEVELALLVSDELQKQSALSVRVISVPCFALFFAQDKAYREKLLFGGGLKVSIEAGISLGWHRFIGDVGLAIAIDDFGLSGPADDLRHHFGFTPQAICQRIDKALKNKKKLQ